MQNVNIIFFGSTHDSLIVLEKLHTAGYTITAVITQPPRPIGRKQTITPTPTELWATEHNITTLSFKNSSHGSFLYENEDAVINTLETFKADLLISASYGQKIPTKTITDARLGGLNVHPSLLPRWRGADPIPWQILAGDHQTGATIVTLTEKMDEGVIVAQQKIPLLDTVTREPLRQTLFEQGADLLVKTLPFYIDGTLKGSPQRSEHAVFARRLNREDGYIPWNLIKKALRGEHAHKEEFPPFLQQFLDASDQQSTVLIIDRAIRAFSPWPGVWTTIQNETKRMKLLSAHTERTEHRDTLVLDQVHIEGKTPVDFRTLPIERI